VKPSPFEYVAPASIDEALERLRASDGAKVLAGGQSLMPMLNLRLTAFDELIDLGGIDGLDYIEPGEGGVRIGAMTRQRQVEKSPVIAQHVPLLREALRYVGHAATRSRGTVGGSIVHADPSAEIGTVLLALGGRLRVRGAGDRDRWIDATDLFITYFTSALEPDEIAVEAWFPGAPSSSGSAFLEVARRSGDFALASAAAQVVIQDRVIRRASVAIGGASAVARRISAAEQALVGADTADGAAVRAAAETVRNEIQGRDDLHGSAEYRLHVAGVLFERAVRLAVRRASANGRSDA
jgi:CO/xanthine dehydrogenase FAD-binding subunit